MNKALSTLLAVTVVSAALTACGGESASSAEPAEPTKIEGVGAIEVDEDLRSRLPDDVLERGTLEVATNAPFPPYEMFASETDKTLVGLEPDLGHALGNKLGVTFTFSQQPYDGIIPGLQAGKYDLVFASMFDTAEREKVVDVINYSASGSGILVRAGNPDDVTGAAGLCELTVGTQTGSFQVNLTKEFSARCQKSGDEPIESKSYPQASDAYLALETGQIDAILSDIPAMTYSLEQPANEGKFELVEDPESPQGYESAPVGVAAIKGSELTPVLKDTIQALMDDGTYAQLLEKWNVPDIAIDKATVNVAGS